MRRFLLCVAGMAALAPTGCGGGSEGGSATTSSAPKAQTGAFKSADVGFTFRYPTEFEQVEDPDGGDALASVTPVPGDKQNAIKIREIAPQELLFASYSATIRQQFADELKTEVSQRIETSGDLELGVLEWQTKGLHSINYMFAGAGKTWQLECLSTKAHRTAIEEACRQAMESLAFTN